MKSATLAEIKKELSTLKTPRLVELCLQLAKYKADNKELLTYLLYESEDEEAYRRGIISDMDLMFEEVNTSNVYYAKKGFRKILRTITKYIKYSGNKETEITLLTHFCESMKNSGVPIFKNSVLTNLFDGQVKKIKKAISSLHEDLQFDYASQLEGLEER